MKLGRENVVMGNVPSDLEMGDGNVVIGPTDSHGNTIVNNTNSTPMAVGRGAQAGPGSIAIGAGANAGSAVTPRQVTQEQIRTAKATQDTEAVDLLEQTNTEVGKPTPDKSILLRAWSGVQAAASIAGAYSLVKAITKFFRGL